MNTELLLPVLRLILGTGFVYLTYVFLLKKQIDGTSSRVFLLGGTLLFTIFPFFLLSVSTDTPVYIIQLPEMTDTSAVDTTANIRPFPWVWLIYWTMVAITGIRLLLQLRQLSKLRQQGQTFIQNGLRITESDAIRSPFSFGKQVFLPIGMEPETRHLVLAHEEIHIRQRHTWDILWLESLKIVGWFNPFYYLLEKELRQAHEFTADQAILRTNISSVAYYEALLSCALAGMRAPVNYFHESSIKTRIAMMNKSKNRQRTAVVSVLALLVIGNLAILMPHLIGKGTAPENADGITVVGRMDQEGKLSTYSASFTGATFQPKKPLTPNEAQWVDNHVRTFINEGTILLNQRIQAIEAQNQRRAHKK